jgi:hypothetical protein
MVSATMPTRAMLIQHNFQFEEDRWRAERYLSLPLLVRHEEITGNMLDRQYRYSKIDPANVKGHVA